MSGSPIVAGLLLLAAFVAWELRTPAPMLPMRFFRNRTFALANAVSLFMSFGMFGAIFLLAQYFQTVQGYSPLQSGLRFLPWTAMPMIVAPIAGVRSDKIGGYKLLAVGLALQAAGLAWIAAIATPTTLWGVKTRVASQETAICRRNAILAPHTARPVTLRAGRSAYRRLTGTPPNGRASTVQT